MIVDRVEHAPLYHCLGRRFAAALGYLRRTDFSTLAPGTYPIEDKAIFALVQEYETKPRDKGLWEAHRRYADIQCVIVGAEQMGYAPLHGMSLTQDYDPEKDFSLFKGDGQFLAFRPGTFAIFLPQDVHMPGQALDSGTGVPARLKASKTGEDAHPTPRKVRKVVIKVQVDGPA